MHSPKLDKARSLIAKDPRYAGLVALLMSKEDVITTENLPYPTAATDGVKHYWHPEFVDSESVDELRKTKLHELAHDFLYHTDGRGKAISEKWGQDLSNIALDHAVNNFIVDCGETLGHDWICDRKYQGWSAEEIAFDLAKDANQTPASAKACSGSGGGHELMQNATPEQQKQARDKTEEAIANSFMMDAIKTSSGLEDDSSEGQGSMSIASMLERARANRQPFVDWRLELADFCGSSRTNERTSTYSRVCRRPIPGLIRPGKKREGKPHIGVILDTSGSMYCALSKLMVELEALSDDGYSFEVICTDGEVYGPYEFEAGEFDYRSLPLQGGGGSDMKPAFEMAREVLDCDAIVFCTDGCIKWPNPDTLSQLPPCLLIEVDKPRMSKVEGFSNHLLIKD